MNTLKQINFPIKPVITLLLPIFLLTSNALPALTLESENTIPHVSNKGKSGFTDYLFAIENKAYAIAPGGAWAWSSGKTTIEEAKKNALSQCSLHTYQQCVLYSLNDELVFNAKQWPTLWGEYKTRSEAEVTPQGVSIGRRFPDLSLKDSEDKNRSLKDFKDNVVLLHFWGSWCPPCCKELPKIEKLSQKIKANGVDVEIVMVPVREDYASAKAWIAKESIHLPLYDSGAHNGEGGDYLKLRNGNTVNDRALAQVFPTTYIIDKHGVILFRHTGPIHKWDEYYDFLVDASRNSGK